MPTPTKGPRLGGSPAHQRLLLSNLATALFTHGQITTTEAKAKRLRPLAEKMITFAKRGDLHARRQVLTLVRDKAVVHTLFAEIGPRFATRPGGYTRITKIGPRKGDSAPMAVIELVESLTVAQEAVGEAERARGSRFRRDADRAAAGAATGSAVAQAPAALPTEGDSDDLPAEGPQGRPAQVAVPTEGGDTQVVTEAASPPVATATEATATEATVTASPPEATATEATATEATATEPTSAESGSDTAGGPGEEPTSTQTETADEKSQAEG